MLVPLLAVVLFSQGAPTSSPFTGIWGGTLSYEKDGQTQVILITEFVVTSDLKVSGEYGTSGLSGFGGILFNKKGRAEIRLNHLEELFFHPTKEANAFARIDGPIEVVTVDGKITLRSKQGLKPGQGLIYRYFAPTGTSKDKDYDAVLELHPKPIKGATAPLILA